MWGCDKRAARAQSRVCDKARVRGEQRAPRRRVSELKDHGFTGNRAGTTQQIQSWTGHNQMLHANVHRGPPGRRRPQEYRRAPARARRRQSPRDPTSSGGWPLKQAKHTFFMMRAILAVGRYLSSSRTDPSSSPPPVPAPASAMMSAAPPTPSQLSRSLRSPGLCTHAEARGDVAGGTGWSKSVREGLSADEHEALLTRSGLTGVARTRARHARRSGRPLGPSHQCQRGLARGKASMSEKKARPIVRQ